MSTRQVTERDTVLIEFDTGILDDTVDNLADEVVRLRRILSALREPTGAVVDAVYDIDLRIDWRTYKNIIRAAVAAAEKEVGA